LGWQRPKVRSGVDRRQLRRVLRTGIQCIGLRHLQNPWSTGNGFRLAWQRLCQPIVRFAQARCLISAKPATSRVGTAGNLNLTLRLRLATQRRVGQENPPGEQKQRHTQNRATNAGEPPDRPEDLGAPNRPVLAETRPRHQRRVQITFYICGHERDACPKI
jgi:hypothetical protein